MFVWKTSLTKSLDLFCYFQYFPIITVKPLCLTTRYRFLLLHSVCQQHERGDNITFMKSNNPNFADMYHCALYSIISSMYLKMIMKRQTLAINAQKVTIMSVIYNSTELFTPIIKVMFSCMPCHLTSIFVLITLS